MDPRAIDFNDWDVRISDGKIEYFDPTLSYEATGYRPIDETHGLNFDPEWFMHSRRTKEQTGKYCPYPFNSLPYRDFWTEEGWRCREGMSVNGYTITGDNYYFINFYKLLSLDVEKSGEGRDVQTPDFYVEQYKYFHYVELARFYGYNCCTLKARGIGWSEINAAMVVNCYTWRPNTRCMITAPSEAHLMPTVKKAFDQMNENNSNTEGGMRRLRQKKDTELYRRSSHIIKIDGQELEAGQKSEVEGRICNNPRNMRGDRTDILLMEESGCHAKGTKVLMYDGSIKNVEDIRVGDLLMGDNGYPRKVLRLHSGRAMMYKVISKDGSVQIVNGDHILYYNRLSYYNHKMKPCTIHTHEFFEESKTYCKVRKHSNFLERSGKIFFEHKDTSIDPYKFGYGIFSDGVFVYDDIPDEFKVNDRDTLSKVMTGIVDVIGSYDEYRNIVNLYIPKNKEKLADDIEFICHALCMRVTRESGTLSYSKRSRKNVELGDCHKISIINGFMDLPLHHKVKGMKEREDKYPLYEHFKVEEYKVDDYYGFVVDGNHLFLLADFTICHNSWPDMEKAYEQGKSLVKIQGRRIGNIFCFGTGGDSGPNLAGLANIFNNPQISDVLGYKHNYTKSGEYVITGFFVPAFNIVRPLMDHRGFTSERAGKEFFLKERDKLLADPKKYLIYCAENCWTPEEALALEGDNRFNTEALTEQKSRIVNMKATPEELLPKRGKMDFLFQDGKVDENGIRGVTFTPTLNGDVVIIEHPRQSPEGGVYRNLYVIGIDGIDLGGDETSEFTKHPSDFALVVKRRAIGLEPPMYVAFYRARPDNINEAFSTALKLIIYYNARALIEKTKITFLTYMRGKKLDTKYMMHRPRATMSDIHGGYSKEMGAPANETTIQHGLNLIANYVDEYASEIWYTPIIDELITYSYKDKRKFDYVAAMQMAELADEEISQVPVVADKPLYDVGKPKYMYCYYTDEHGYKKRGRRLVEKKKPSIKMEVESYSDGVVYRSNPMFNGDIIVDEEGLL